MPSSAADEFELFHKNRALVAKEYQSREGQLSGAHIAIRTPRDDSNWFGRFLGGDRAKRMEVQALLIDSLPEDATASPVIVDESGSLVGYFMYSVTEDGGFRSHRAQFVTYLVKSGRLIRREGELKCQKIIGSGAPRVNVGNASWDADLGTLSFTVRSSCNHIEVFGSGPRRTLNMMAGTFGFDSNSKDAAWADWGQKLRVLFDPDGENFGFDIDKGDAQEQRAFRKCADDAAKTSAFHVCIMNHRRSVYWQFEGRRLAVRLCERVATVAQGKTYVAEGCMGDSADAILGRSSPRADSPDDKVENRWVDIMVAAEAAPQAIETMIQCTCGRLGVDRISFDPDVRSVSFNLNTDAKEISVEGVEVPVPISEPRTREGLTTVQIPLLTLKFNERWQAVELTVAAGTSHQSGKQLDGSSVVP